MTGPVARELSYAAEMERTPFTVATESGDLSGWVTGEGPRVLALHGGPGMNFAYLDDAVSELAARYQVATFQQRGLAPSTEQGAFTIAEALDDIAAVLDGLDWDTAYLVGHSWGGHLAFHAALGIPGRLAGVLSVDPLGAVGDGGVEAFGAEMLARVPDAARERARVLDEKDTAGKATPEEELEAFSLFWASYFADPAGRSADAARGVLPAGEPGAVGRSDGPPPRARVVATVDHGPVRRARRRAEPDAAQRRHRECRAHPWRLVAGRAGSGPLRLARGAGLPPCCDGSARRSALSDLAGVTSDSAGPYSAAATASGRFASAAASGWCHSRR